MGKYHPTQIIDCMNRHFPGYVEKLCAVDMEQQPRPDVMLKAFLECGANVFDVGPVLASTFEFMDVHNITHDMVHLPYGCFYIHMPETQLGDFDCWVDEFGVNQRSYRPMIGMYVWSFGDDVYLCPALDVEGGVDGSMGCACYPMRMNHWQGAGCSYEAFCELDSTEAWSHKEGDPDEARLWWRSLCRIVLNLLMYLRSDQVEVAYSDKRKPRIRRAPRPGKRAKASKRQSTVLRVGRLAQSLESKGQRLSPSRHWVRGHWKRVRYGKGRTKTKIKAIWPYERGRGEHSGDIRVYESQHMS